MQEAVKKDKSRVNVLKLTEFGLVQMTRKRNRDNLLRTLCEPCPYCAGEALVKSRRTICYDIYRKISRDAKKMNGGSITLKVHPKVADLMLKEEANTTESLEREMNKQIAIVPCKDLHIEKYVITWVK